MKYPFIDIFHILVVISLLTRLLQTINTYKYYYYQTVLFLLLKLFVSFTNKNNAKRNEGHDNLQAIKTVLFSDRKSVV